LWSLRGRFTVAIAGSIALVSSAGLAACSSHTSGSSQASAPTAKYVSGKTVTVRLATDWTNFDIQVRPSLGNVQLVLPAYDRLLDFDGKKVVPYLATSWTSTPTSVTFTVRTGATCSDGTPVTPTVIANSFKRLINPSTQFSNLTQLFGTGTLSIVPNNADHTIKFTSSVPYSNLIYAFADPATSIICPAGLANPAALQTQMFGSGPYTLVSATHNSQVVFKLRKDWNWGPYGITSKTLGLPATLIYKIVADETTSANLLTTGGLTLGTVTGPDVARLLANSSLTHLEVQNTSAAIMSMDQAAGHPTADRAVRQALITAVDPSVWPKVASGGYGLPATSYLAPSTLCYDPKTKDLLPKYSVKAAQAVLTKDGYTLSNGVMTKGGQPLKITVLGLTTQNSGPDYLAAQFKALGATVNLVKVDFATYASDLEGSNFSWDVTVAQLQSIDAFAALPSTFAVPYMSGKTAPEGGFNLYNIVDPTLESYIAKGLSTTGTQSCAAWAQVQERYLTQYDFLPLDIPIDNWFSSNVHVQTPIEPLTWRVESGS
jgi:peptide/nickel transport system substrate-binding protein